MKERSEAVREEAIGILSAFIEEALEGAAVPMKAIMQVNVASDEILSNIVRYSGATLLTVRCRAEDGEIRIDFFDDGVPYDPTAQPEPDVTLSAEERGVGGLGIFMVKKLMKSVVYAREGERNRLTVTKAY